MLTAGLLFSLNAVLLANTAWRAYTTAGRQFFPFASHLFTATDAIALMTGFALFTLYFSTMAVKRLLFGRLRLIEEEHLREFGWMTASESLLAMTVFRNQFDAGFVLLFAAVLAVKAVHWVAKDRQEMMEQSVRLPEYYHFRMVGCLLFLLIVDVCGVAVSAASLYSSGPSMALLLISDFTILLLSVVAMSCKYGVAVYEQRQRISNDAFELSLFSLDRSTLLYYFDVLIDLCKLSTYLIFFMAIIVVYGLPLHLLRELYLTVISFVKRCQDVIKYRQATENMNARYPDASEPDLERVHHLCIICRDELRVAGVGGVAVAQGRRAKVLPCGHCFHFKCLRSWLERQQACPTCRSNVLISSPPAAPPVVVVDDPQPNNHNSNNNTQQPPNNNQGDNVKESIESLRRQMEELQRNMSETANLIRSMSNSHSTITSVTDSPPRASLTTSRSDPIDADGTSGSPLPNMVIDDSLDDLNMVSKQPKDEC